MAERNIAEQLAEKQREIGVAEFFSRNRHLLGFDNKRKALLTTVKEAVDNSLDACEEAEILPEIIVEIIDMGNERFRVIVEDNGPGIVQKQIGKIFVVGIRVGQEVGRRVVHTPQVSRVSTVASAKLPGRALHHHDARALLGCAEGGAQSGIPAAEHDDVEDLRTLAFSSLGQCERRT